jgi:ribonucleoside-diphosphate reductase beta chain
MTNIFENQEYLHPDYQHLDKYTKMMYRSIWTPAAYQALIEEQDAPHYHNELISIDKEAIKRCLLSVAIVEDTVKTFWMTLHKDFPQVIISDVGGLFGAQEVTHRKSYHHLLDVLKVDKSEIDGHKPLRDKIKYLKKYNESDPRLRGERAALKRLTLFTALTERVSLLPCFYILSSWAKAKKGLETISKLQKSTAQEELLMHYQFGIDIINIVKKQKPSLWNEYLEEFVAKNIKMAYKSELALIDWFFENGVPDHITKEEILNFTRYNFRELCKDLDIDHSAYVVDEELYEKKNSWFMVRILSSTDSDFFLNEVGNYANEEEEINIDEFKF